MKSMKKLQVAVAIAALFAATGSMAASISQSGVTVAREVIANNTQVLRAPTVTFNYVGALSTNANSSQDFSITLQLSSPDVGGAPRWNGAALPNHESIEVKFNNGAAAQVPVLASGTTPAATVAIESLGIVAEGNDTLRYRFRLVNNTASAANLNNVQVSFNVTTAAFGAATVSGIDLAAQPAPGGIVYGTVLNLATVAGTVDADGAPEGTGAKADVCSDGDRKVAVTARNFTGSGDGVIGESGTAGVTNNGYILFSQALNVMVGKGVAPNRSTSPALENKSLSTDLAGFGTATSMALGFIKFRNLDVDAWDTDIAGSYYKLRTGAPAGDLSSFGVLRTDGAVDTNNLQVSLFSTSGFAANSTFVLANNPMCVGAGAGNLISSAGASVLSNGNLDAALTFTHAQLVSVITGGVAGSLSTTTGNNLANGVGAPITGYTATTDRVYLCYVNTGADVIPQSTFQAIAKLTKETGANEQTNQSCRKPMAGLGGGVKIDVRNFYPYTSDDQEWISVLRVINNSETTDADLTGQYIRADGKYGRYGSLGTLPARGAVYFSSKEIDTLLNTNSNTNGADNTGGGGTTAAAGKVAPNTRVRVSSNAASTLRVQNYMFNTRTLQLVEVSASQGADFVNVEASDRDHIDQDAQTGIQK